MAEGMSWAVVCMALAFGGDIGGISRPESCLISRAGRPRGIVASFCFTYALSVMHPILAYLLLSPALPFWKRCL